MPSAAEESFYGDGSDSITRRLVSRRSIAATSNVEGLDSDDLALVVAWRKAGSWGSLMAAGEVSFDLRFSGRVLGLYTPV